MDRAGMWCVEQETSLGGILGPQHCLPQAWTHLRQRLELAGPPPHQVTATLSGQLLQHTEETQACSVPTLPLTSMMAPEGYSSPRQCQPWSFETELVLKSSLKQTAPVRAVGGQEQEEKAEQGSRATNHRHCERI